MGYGEEIHGFLDFGKIGHGEILDVFTALKFCEVSLRTLRIAS